ncbi:hypothetical protein BGAL_0192g00040 [Botrytis galanthina]|uniref:Uncharacterized protein n=1 Tax=Botrytis galanthina TaxID=278940 RepID=A0A4S8QW01_9HELO|nr:hypothetical protein BGAL_0192g00040 [Botrytis galanthina]
MAVIEITPIVNNCCVQCCKEEQYGDHDYCVTHNDMGTNIFMLWKTLDRTKWGLPLLGNNGIMASEHRRMEYNPIIWVETDGMGHLAWVEFGNRIG